MKIDIPIDFSTEDITLLLSFADTLGVSINTSSLPVEEKIIKGIVNCNLCKTTTTQYIKMVRYQNGSWHKKEDVEEQEYKETYQAKILACWACKNVLLQHTKEELVDMILKFYAPIPTRIDVLKHVNEIRKTPLKVNRRA